MGRLLEKKIEWGWPHRCGGKLRAFIQSEKGKSTAIPTSGYFEMPREEIKP